VRVPGKDEHGYTPCGAYAGAGRHIQCARDWRNLPFGILHLRLEILTSSSHKRVAAGSLCKSSNISSATKLVCTVSPLSWRLTERGLAIDSKTCCPTSYLYQETRKSNPIPAKIANQTINVRRKIRLDNSATASASFALGKGQSGTGRWRI